ncbi:MAG TPA: plastocyanin/azurin family copper-binding protein [Actinomycetota bacterium]|nr:plastocyanin/azurin family copper-binding protein [Actinomycetota bacterium]
MILRAKPLVLLIAIFSLLAVGVACGGGEDGDTTEPAQAPETTAPPSGEITVRAVEYSFLDVPTTIAAGETTFTLVNEGAEPHFFGLAKLTDDAPPATEIVQLPQKKVMKFLEKELGETSTAKPGQTSKKSLTAELTPGRYGYVCFVFSPKEKAPHALLGMVGEFTVE